MRPVKFGPDEKGKAEHHAQGERRGGRADHEGGERALAWLATYFAFVAVNSPPTFIGWTLTDPAIFSAVSSVPL